MSWKSTGSQPSRRTVLKTTAKATLGAGALAAIGAGNAAASTEPVWVTNLSGADVHTSDCTPIDNVPHGTLGIADTDRTARCDTVDPGYYYVSWDDHNYEDGYVDPDDLNID